MQDARFIVELLPALPILLNLLPPGVETSAGRAHDLSAGAMNLLLSAGFETTDLCDIFDGGPAIDCRTDRTIIAQTVFQATGGGIQPADTDLKYLHWTGEGAAYRATLGPAYPEAHKAGEAACETLGTSTPFVALAQSRRAR